MAKKEFELRVDVLFSEKNMKKDILKWLKKKHSHYKGSKADFIRDLIIHLYEYDNGLVKEQDNLKKEVKEEVKEEILGYLMNQLNGNLIKTEEENKGITKEVSQEQAKTQDLLLGQLDI